MTTALSNSDARTIRHAKEALGLLLTGACGTLETNYGPNDSANREPICNALIDTLADELQDWRTEPAGFAPLTPDECSALRRDFRGRWGYDWLGNDANLESLWQDTGDRVELLCVVMPEAMSEAEVFDAKLAVGSPAMEALAAQALAEHAAGRSTDLTDRSLADGPVK